MKFDVRLISVAVAVGLAVVLIAVFAGNDPVSAGESEGLELTEEQGQWALNVEGIGEIFRSDAVISNTRSIAFKDTPTRAITWVADSQSYAAISLDGKNIKRTTRLDDRIMLRFAEFDPMTQMPRMPRSLTARPNRKAAEKPYIVQFVTQPLDEYREMLAIAGVKIHHYIPNQAYLVTMSDEARTVISGLPYVRWIGQYQPAYKLEEFLVERLSNAPESLKPARYNIMAIERGEASQNDIGRLINMTGGRVDNIVPEGFRMEATLDGQQLLELAQHEKVMFIDRWSAPEQDMDLVRTVGGANFVENLTGFRGQGVRAEVMDNGFRQTHFDFQLGGPPMLHNIPNPAVGSHGTATYGINFGRGTANLAGVGMMPEATGIYADYTTLGNRYAHTARLVAEPYNAVYQSNSWGSALTTAYTTISAEMDDILMQNDVTILNSQSNAGTQSSRPQAWAKNVVSIGGIRHYNTASLADDRWASGASVGPAADGRIKPDIAHFYDSIFTTGSGSDSSYTSTFGGTSAATPITAGHFGIFFQMWHNGLFGNVTGPTVFESRPKAATAKAVMINTAMQWDMNIAGTDTTRVRQGWGRVDLTNLYSLKNNMIVVNEVDRLTNLQSTRYRVRVVNDAPRFPLKITMVYKDPMGTPGATRARVNDLTMRVTAPDGTVYWGNVGLGVGGGMFSTPGGTGNIVDTVENVFIENPMVGTWLVDIFANEVVTDAVPETPAVDVTFSLVATGPISTQ
jgi:serine protease AprX